MSSFHQLARTADWFQWKIPPLLAVGYAMILINGIAFWPGFYTLFLLITSICSVGAYGHVVNDIFDIEQDLAAGKRNAMAKLSPSWRFFWVFLFIATGFLSLYLLTASLLMVALLFLNYLLPTIYSIPPFRLKERGILGVLADTSAAHLLPVLLIAISLNSIENISGLQNFILLVFAAIWAFFLGLRGIISHQVLDLQHDRKTNVVTFAGNKSREYIRSLILQFCYPAEMIGLTGFMGAIILTSPLVTGFLCIFIMVEFSKMARGWKFTLVYPERPGSERYLPFLNNEFYEAWLPVILALELLWITPLYGLILTLHIVLFRNMLKERLVLYSRIFYSFIK